MLRKNSFLALIISLTVASCGKGPSTASSIEQSAPDDPTVFTDQQIKIAVQNEPLVGEKPEAVGERTGIGLVEVVHTFKVQQTEGKLSVSFNRTACTGTLLDNDDVITSAHCIPKRIRGGADCGNVVFRHSALDVAYRCDSIKWVSKKFVLRDGAEDTPGVNGPDLAVFHLAKSPPNLTPVKLATAPFPSRPNAEPEDIPTLKILAYTPRFAAETMPEATDGARVKNVSKKRIQDFLFTERVPCAQADDAREGNFVRAVGCKSEHGNSGAPLFNERFEVQGILLGFSAPTKKASQPKTLFIDASCLVPTSTGYEWKCAETAQSYL